MDTNDFCIKFSNVKDLDLRHTFLCGQCFRWEENESGSFYGVVGSKAVKVSLQDDVLIIEGDREENREFWNDYFDLNRDYGAIKTHLSSQDEFMAEAISFGWGIRILKQDLWESILSFIISQNNHIPRIKGCIRGLSESFGEPCTGITKEKNIAFGIPGPEKIATLNLDALAPIKLGYRASYILDCARYIVENGLPKDYEGLLKLKGVGPKVANCINLFALQAYDSFPVDVWVAKVMEKAYGLNPKKPKEIEEFGRKNFGKLGGFAQQYLFYYMRENKL